MLIGALALLSLGAGGSIASLTVSGGQEYGQMITVYAAGRAESKINNSNFYFEIRAPDGTVVDTATHGLPRLEDGDSYSYTWTSNNTAYPVRGDYTVFLCWSPGNSTNCQIASATTSFYSVPTLSIGLIAVAALLIAWWIWVMRRRWHAARSAEG
jgi:hypothetical protein